MTKKWRQDGEEARKIILNCTIGNLLLGGGKVCYFKLPGITGAAGAATGSSIPSRSFKPELDAGAITAERRKM